MLEDLLNESVVVTLQTWALVRGQRTATVTATVTLSASVQPMRAQRRLLYGLEAAVTAYTVYFSTDPAVNVGDILTRANGVTLGVLAPARDEAGRAQLWAVDCQANQ